MGDGPNAAGLEPKPANFHDQERQQYRNIYSLFSTISLGVDGTAMKAFTELTSQQRWQLAFYVSNFYAGDTARNNGEQIWSNSRSDLIIHNLQQLTQTTPAKNIENSWKGWRSFACLFAS